MIAVISLPGGRNHEAVRVANRAEAETFFAAWLARHGETLETQQAHRQRHTLTEREALKVRYRDGSRVYAHVRSLADWQREGERK